MVAVGTIPRAAAIGRAAILAVTASTAEANTFVFRSAMLNGRGQRRQRRLYNDVTALGTHDRRAVCDSVANAALALIRVVCQRSSANVGVEVVARADGAALVVARVCLRDWRRMHASRAKGARDGASTATTWFTDIASSAYAP